MIKVMQIIPTLGVGGAEKLVLDISKTLNKNKFKVYVVTFFDRDEFEFDYDKYEDITFISLHKKLGFDFSVVTKLIKIFKEIKPDIIHTHTYVVPYLLIPYLLGHIKCKIHTVHSIAEYELSEKNKKIMYFGYHFFNITPVGISPTVVDSIKKVYKVKNVELIHNCVDTEKYSLKSAKNNLYFELINVARLSDVKNHDLMIEAFAKAFKCNDRLRLKIVGDGPLRNDLEEKVKLLNMESYVTFKGVSKNIPLELSNSDAFILTSKFEGLPLSILEAMSCGLPIITTNVGGVSDIVLNDYNGYLTEQNSDSIAKAIIDISLDNKKYIEFSNNSSILSKKYDIKRMVKEYEDLYEREYNQKK